MSKISASKLFLSSQIIELSGVVFKGHCAEIFKYLNHFYIEIKARRHWNIAAELTLSLLKCPFLQSIAEVLYFNHFMAMNESYKFYIEIKAQT